VEDELKWLKRTQRLTALRMVVIGVIIALGGVGWLVLNQDWVQSEEFYTDNTHAQVIRVEQRIDPRMFGWAAVAVGGAIAVAGAILMARSHKDPT